MKKNKVAKIFVIASILFMIALCGIYGYRLIYYYRLEHPKVKQEQKQTLASRLIEPSNIVTSGDGLYQDNNTYYYKGIVSNNYIEYSGILWRIVRINQDQSITMISETPLTSMVFGYQTDKFEQSYAYKWLNEEFYNKLNNSKQYIVDTHYCVDTIESAEKISCNEQKTSKIAMMNIFEYLKASGSKSYLNSGKNFWTVNPSNGGKIWFINQKGLVTDESFSGSSYHSYGIKPMITIKGDLTITKGNGTIEEPLEFETKTNKELKNVSIGNYVNYSDQMWRIVDVNDFGIKIALDGYVKIKEEVVEKPFSTTSSNIYDIESSKNIGYYLNYTYYKTLKDQDYLVEYPFKISPYNNEQKYNYQVENYETVRAKIGLLQVTDLFIDDFSDYALMTPSEEGTVFTVLEDGRLYADMVNKELKIRPVVVLKESLKIKKGSGTQTDPFNLTV